MDDKWFKQRQKIAGVTAEDIAAKLGRDRSVVSRIYVGRQPMSLDQAQVFAEVLNVPIEQVLQKAGTLTENNAGRALRGFCEGDATPYTPKALDVARFLTIEQALGGARPGIDVWQCNTRAVEQMGLMPGDFMLVDTHQSERTSQGDIVVAQVYDNTQGAAKTVVRRHEPPVLVAASCDPDLHRVHVVDNINVVIRGKIIASWRTI